MAFYSNGMNANPLSSGSGFGGHNARFLQASASNGGLPNGTGQPSGGHHRNGQSPQGNRRRGRRTGGQRPSQQPRRSPKPNGVNKNQFTPNNLGKMPRNGKPQQNSAPRQPGPNNGQRGRRGQRGQHAQKVFIAPAGPRDGDVVMRDAYAPIAAPQPDPDVVMVDAPPLLETRAEDLTRGAMAMNCLASAILDLALNDEALGSTCYQMGGAPFYF